MVAQQLGIRKYLASPNQVNEENNFSNFAPLTHSVVHDVPHPGVNHVCDHHGHHHDLHRIRQWWQLSFAPS